MFDRQLLFLILSLVLGSTTAQPASAAVSGSSCQLACSGNKECEVRPLAASGKPVVAGKWRRMENCQLVTIAKGPVDVRYLHQNQWLIGAQLGTTSDLTKHLNAKAPDPCPLPTADCLQLAMDRRAATGGHGIDQRESKPGGEGSPCALGLPCGQVLPSREPAEWQLARSDIQGRLILVPARGQGAALEYPVQAGRLRVERAAWQPATVYSYRLLDAEGKQLASGEFALLAAAMPERLRGLANKRASETGVKPEQAWVDLLVQNRLWWDALLTEPGDAS